MKLSEVTQPKTMKLSQVMGEPEQKSVDSYGLNLARDALQGLTLNTSDEAGAAVAALVATLKDGADFKEAYNDILSQVNREQDSFREENPKAALAAQVAGGIATGAAGLSKVAAKTAGLHGAKRLGANALLGATEGGIAGYAGAQGEDRATSGVIGAAGGLVLNTAAGEIANAFTKNAAAKKVVKKLLEDGSTDKKVAKYVLNGVGKVKTDPVATKAISGGVDEGVVALVKGSSRSDKSKFRKMLAHTQRGRQNARERALNRANDVAGESIVSRIKVVNLANRKAGAQIKKAAESLKGKAGNFDSVVDDFVGELNTMGIKIGRGADGEIIPLFEDSAVEGLGALEKPLKKIIYRMQKGNYDGYRAHELKQYIDEFVQFGKTPKGGLAGKTERAIKSLRHNLKESLNEQFPEYGRVNGAYAETKAVLDDLRSTAGSKIDILGRNSDKALGTLSRSVMSNIRSRGGMLNTLDDLDKMAAKYGGQFDDDIISQAVFSNELDRLFGAQAQTSLQGDAQKAVTRGMKEGGLKDKAIDYAADKLLGSIDEDELFDVLGDLLKDTGSGKGLIKQVP